MSPTTAQLEAAALAVPCSTHNVPAGAECPDGGACMERYGLSPQQWAGWFGSDGEPAAAPSPSERALAGHSEGSGRVGL